MAYSFKVSRQEVKDGIIYAYDDNALSFYDAQKLFQENTVKVLLSENMIVSFTNDVSGFSPALAQVVTELPAGSAVDYQMFVFEGVLAGIKPDFHEWNAEKAAWVEVANAAAMRLADKRAAMPDLTRVRLFKALYLTKKIRETDIQAVIDAIEDEDTKAIAQIEFQTNSFERNNTILVQAARGLGINDDEIDQMWEVAMNL